MTCSITIIISAFMACCRNNFVNSSDIGSQQTNQEILIAQTAELASWLQGGLVYHPHLASMQSQSKPSNNDEVFLGFFRHGLARGSVPCSGKEATRTPPCLRNPLTHTHVYLQMPPTIASIGRTPGVGLVRCRSHRLPRWGFGLAWPGSCGSV